MPAFLNVFFVDQGNRDFSAVWGDRHEPLALVLVWVVAAEHGLLFFKFALVGIHVVVEHG